VEDHRADAGGAIVQRNEPEPAMVEPENPDVAFLAARQPLGPEEQKCQEQEEDQMNW